MSGLAIILRNQEVESSPLGKISSIGDYATEIATAYCTAIGDVTYYNSIYKLVYDLVERSIYSKFYAIYPMLGDTIAKQCINLISPNINDLHVGANASAGADGKHLAFSNVVGIGDNKPTFIGSVGKYSSHLCFSKNNTSPNTSCWLHYYRTDYDSSVAACGIRTSKISGESNIQVVFYSSLSISTGINVANTPRRVHLINDADNLRICGSVDGAEFEHSTYPSETREYTWLNNGLGANWIIAASTSEGETISASDALANGKAYFHALANLTEEESLVFDGIMAEFLTSVKGI